MKKRIAVIGENTVQKALHKSLTSKELECKLLSYSEILSNKNGLRFFDCVILPFPSKGDNVAFIREKDSKELFSEEQLVVGGLLDGELKESLADSGTRPYDYFLDEAYVLKNANLTYQGVLKLLLENTDTFLAGKTALVTGFGRIAKPLCLALRNLGINVYVAVRSDIQKSEARMEGFNVLDINRMKGALFYFDFFFNTVPFNIFDERDIKHFKDSSVYFEIASMPYGATGEHFGLYGKKYVLASALPGKFYPMGVAENIVDYLLRRGVI